MRLQTYCCYLVSACCTTTIYHAICIPVLVAQLLHSQSPMICEIERKGFATLLPIVNSAIASFHTSALLNNDVHYYPVYYFNCANILFYVFVFDLICTILEPQPFSCVAFPQMYMRKIVNNYCYTVI